MTTERAAKPGNSGFRAFCHRCQKYHTIGEGNARKHCRNLMSYFSTHQRLPLQNAPEHSDDFSTDYLFGKAGGKMFGCLECEAPDGSIIILKAFSGQYNKHFAAPGWADPLFDVDTFIQLSRDTDEIIHRLSREIAVISGDSELLREKKSLRRQLSRTLMADIFSLYSLINFRKQKATIFEAALPLKSLPTGIGDCCAPKLFNQAARENLRPLGLAEFYWGNENRSGTRMHGGFFPPCQEKCLPILGFLLCGLDLSENENG